MASVIIGLKIVLYRRFPMGYQSLSGMIKGAGIVKPHFCYKKLTGFFVRTSMVHGHTELHNHYCVFRNWRVWSCKLILLFLAFILGLSFPLLPSDALCFFLLITSFNIVIIIIFILNFFFHQV